MKYEEKSKMRIFEHSSANIEDDKCGIEGSFFWIEVDGYCFAIQQREEGICIMPPHRGTVKQVYKNRPVGGVGSMVTVQVYEGQ